MAAAPAGRVRLRVLEALEPCRELLGEGVDLGPLTRLQGLQRLAQGPVGAGTQQDEVDARTVGDRDDSAGIGPRFA